MSDVITINTADSLVKPTQVEPLPLYNENHFLLKEVMPEYTDTLPNPVMFNLIERLRLTMKQYGGIGLSANQCGVAERVFVMGYDDWFLACINPKVIESSAKLVTENEGCLSFPALYGKIPRPESIKVEFTNPLGEVVQTTLEGLTARCFLHELDHMNGIKFTEHMGPVSLRMARQKQEKRIKSVKRRMKK